MYWYEYRAMKKKTILKKMFQVDKQPNFWKNHEKCERTKRYQTNNNLSKKELFYSLYLVIQQILFS